ncbi:MAG: hypothetical protein ACI923_000200 [Flavobacteriales bacterium]|jgi:hypothetical protein
MFLLLCASSFLFTNSSSGQCAFGGLNYGNVTPVTIGETVELLGFVWGGDQYTLQATAGCVYTVSTCGTSWDTQITIFDASQTSVAYNDDACGLQSSVTFTAAQSGAYTIQVNQYFCASNSIGAEYFGVTLVSCLSVGGCDNPAACNYVAADTNASNCCFDECVSLSIGGGTFDGEISWAILDDLGAQVGGGVATPGVNLCLSAGCYSLMMYDSFGDGWNGASYELSDNSGSLIGVGTLITGSSGTAVLQVGGADCGVGEIPESIVVDASTYSAEQLITEVFLGDCLSAENIVFSGVENAIGTFSNGGGIGIEEGIILSTGSAVDAVGPNSSGSISTANIGGSSPLLEELTGEFTYDAVEFSFDFQASTTEVTFEYVFASDEYPEFVCSFNDAFAFFISGPGYATNTNISLVPGTTDFVSIDNVNDNGIGCPPYYPAFYNDNSNGFAIEYDGYTVPLQATITTVPCETYQITIALADIGDGLYDSAVFLKAQSFSAGIDVATAASGVGGLQSTPASCEESGSFVFVNYGEPFTEETTINFTLTGTAIAGFDYAGIPTSVTFQPGEVFVVIDVLGILDNLDVIPTSLIMTMDETCSCDAPADISLYLCSQLMLPVDWISFEANLQNLEEEVLCQWQVDSQVNNEYFAIERSGDGLYWSEVGKVEGAGTTSEALSYNWVDFSPLQGQSYYRVRQYDFNGATSVSISDEVYRRAKDIHVYPNPSTGVFNVEGLGSHSLKVFDARGREVKISWKSEVSIELVGAEAGFYFFEFTSLSGATTRTRVVVL